MILVRLKIVKNAPMSRRRLVIVFRASFAVAAVCLTLHTAENDIKMP